MFFFRFSTCVKSDALNKHSSLFRGKAETHSMVELWYKAWYRQLCLADKASKWQRTPPKTHQGTRVQVDMASSSGRISIGIRVCNVIAPDFVKFSIHEGGGSPWSNLVPGVELHLQSYQSFYYDFQSSQNYLAFGFGPVFSSLIPKILLGAG